MDNTTPLSTTERNRRAWDQRVDYHLASEFYQQKAFLQGADSLKHIERELLGDVAGQSILHLQCHFGQDTLSLARWGAQPTGVDFSQRAIEVARSAADRLQLSARFVQSDVLALREHLQGQFDWVFTSYGTIVWLPDLRPWGEIIAHYLRSGGNFLIVDFHPVLQMFESPYDHLQYSYFNNETVDEVVQGSYATNAQVFFEEITWNHSLAEVAGSLLQAGLQIKRLEEYDYSPYDLFSPGVQLGEEKYAIKGLEGKIPMVFALLAKKE